MQISPQANQSRRACRDDFRARLAITDDVQVSIVASNALMVSVQRQADPDAGFLLAFEGAFLSQLSEEELRAVVAHELGHVWIFTHHPYLQTEQLANGIAMRLVTRESLEPIYDRVWKRVGAVGDIGTYLGEKPSPAIDTLAASVTAGFNPTTTASVLGTDSDPCGVRGARHRRRSIQSLTARGSRLERPAFYIFRSRVLRSGCVLQQPARVAAARVKRDSPPRFAGPAFPFVSERPAAARIRSGR